MATACTALILMKVPLGSSRTFSNAICRTEAVAIRAANRVRLLDSNPLWLCLRMLANRDLQNAVAAGGAHVLGIRSVRQDEAAVEPAMQSLSALLLKRILCIA
jgi:hypothetical protein